MNIFKKLLFYGVLVLSVGQNVFSQEIQNSFTLDGELYDSSGNNLLLDSNVNLRLQILNPSKTCVLYDESRLVNTQSSNGFFSVQVGSLIGSLRRTSGSDPSNDFKKIFQNITPISGTGSSCSGNLYTPLANDVRFLRIIVTPTGGSPNVLQPDMVVGATPVANQARELNGKTENDLIQVSSSVTQANAQSVLSNTTAILGLVSEKTQIDNLLSASLNFVTQSSLTTQLGSKQNSLGYTPLNPANNLSDVSSVANSRTNLGLGSSATKNIPSSGNAAVSEVVIGSDTRLTDSRNPLAHTHVLSEITDAGVLAGLNTVPNDKTTASSLNSSNTIVLRDNNGDFQANNIYSNSSMVIGLNPSPNIVISNLPSTSPFGVSLDNSIVASSSQGTDIGFGISTASDSSNNAIQTNHLLIETGNKTAGTGDSGSILLSPGASAGGTRGNVFVGSNLFPTEDITYDLGSNIDNNRWRSIWGDFVSASSSIGLRNPIDSSPIMTMSIQNNGGNVGPYIVSPFTPGIYSGFGMIGRGQLSTSFTTEHLWMTTGSKNGGTGNTGNIILQPGFLTNGAVGNRGTILLNSTTDMNNNFLVNIPNPTLSSHAANKAYVDSVVNGATSTLATVATSGNYNDLNNKPTLGSLAALSSVGNSNITDLSYSKLTSVPSTFTPSAHTHSISDITNLQTSLDSKLTASKLSLNCTAAQTVQYISITDSYQCQSISISNSQVSGLGTVSTLNSISDANINSVSGSKLTGPVLIGTVAGSSCSSAGLTRYNSGVLEFCNGSSWVLISSASSGSVPVISGMISYSPSISGFTVSNNYAYYRRVGDSLEVYGAFTVSSYSASSVKIGLPSGLAIDSNKFLGSTYRTKIGEIARALNNTTSAYPITNTGPFVLLEDTSSSTDGVFVSFQTNTTAKIFLVANGSSLAAIGDMFSYSFKVPIVGWDTSSNNVVSVTSTNANLIYAGPVSGSAALPSFRSMDITDLPNLSTYNASMNSLVTQQNIGIDSASTTGGQIYGRVNTISSYSSGDISVDLDKGNTDTLPSSYDCGAGTFINLQNGKAGAVYTIVVTGTGTTTCNFKVNGSSATARFAPNNAARIASTHTVYSILFTASSTIYVSWSTGFN